MIDLRYYRDDRDYGAVYRLFTEPRINGNIMNKPDHNDFQSFKKWLLDCISERFNDFFVVYDSEVFVGVAYTYDFRLIDGHTCLSIAVRQEFVGTGVGAQMALAVIGRIFRDYPLRKVFMEVYSDNERCYESLNDAGLRNEARLKEYRFRDGRYEDLLIFSVDRENFRDIESSLCPSLVY